MPDVQIPINKLVEQLEKLRELNGDDAYEAARKALVFQIINKENGETFVKNAWPDLDIAAMKAEAAAYAAKQGSGIGAADTEPPPATEQDDEARPADQLMLQAIQALMPGLTTQGQLNIFMMAFDALKDTLNGAFAQNEAKVAKGQIALTKAIDAAVQSAAMAERLKEIPEGQRSSEASAFVEPPKEFHEYDIQKSLVKELDTLKTTAALNNWYAEHRDRETFDRVASQALRNTLFDAIRKRRATLKAAEQN